MPHTLDLLEVKAYGAENSTVCSSEQTATALFETANTIDQDNQVYRDVAATRRFSVPATVRLLLAGNMTMADSFIGCFDAKYTYAFWRPIMAIRRAAEDGNPFTRLDPTWSPLAPTPPHPEYPGAHAAG